MEDAPHTKNRVGLSIGVGFASILNALYLVPALLLLVTASAKLLYGNDLPFIEMFSAILVGGLLAISLVVFCLVSVKNRRIRPALWIVVITTVFNIAALPVARWMTRFEQDRRYEKHRIEQAHGEQSLIRPVSE